jgi:pimeloyl-ACP methyl ester carboxylesterase
MSYGPISLKYFFIKTKLTARLISMNTPVVVADMVEIIERHAEWRSQEATKWLATTEGQAITSNKASTHAYSREAVLERTQWRKGEEKLNYWGFSYGTLLGATFAALQPHRSQRILIDGVEESNDYYQTGWITNLRDTDAIMHKFYQYCSDAGPEKCALNSGNLTAGDIEDLVETLVTDIADNPVAVTGSKTRGPEIITYSDVLELIRPSLYSPLALFPRTATLLDDIINKNGSAFADFKQTLHKPSCPLQNCAANGGSFKGDCHAIGSEAQSGIMCSDGVDVSYRTKEDVKKNAEFLYRQSKWLGPLWASITAPCPSWQARPAWQIRPGRKAS